MEEILVNSHWSMNTVNSKEEYFQQIFVWGVEFDNDLANTFPDEIVVFYDRNYILPCSISFTIPPTP